MWSKWHRVEILCSLFHQEVQLHPKFLSFFFGIVSTKKERKAEKNSHKECRTLLHIFRYHSDFDFISRPKLGPVFRSFIFFMPPLFLLPLPPLLLLLYHIYIFFKCISSFVERRHFNGKRTRQPGTISDARFDEISNRVSVRCKPAGPFQTLDAINKLECPKKWKLVGGSGWGRRGREGGEA